MTRPDAVESRPQCGDAEEAVDFARYVPTVLSRLVSKLRASANPFFRKKYGISLLEWRIISALAAEGSMTAYAIWTEGGLDKAAVSRALKSLNERRLLTIGPDPQQDGRKRTKVALTPHGRKLHRETFEEVVLRHARLVQGIAPSDLETMMRVLERIERQIPAMSTDTTRPDRTFRITKERSS